MYFTRPTIVGYVKLIPPVIFSCRILMVLIYLFIYLFIYLCTFENKFLLVEFGAVCIVVEV